jgi:hypothetical protein
MPQELMTFQQLFFFPPAQRRLLFLRTLFRAFRLVIFESEYFGFFIRVSSFPFQCLPLLQA